MDLRHPARRSRTRSAGCSSASTTTSALTWAWAIVGTTLVVRIAARPAHRPPDPLDAGAAEARAGDEGDPAEVQGRPPEDERGDDAVLQGEPHQPGRLLPAAPRAGAGVHLPLLRAEELLEARPAGLRPLVAPLRPQHHREGELALVGLRAARRLRREPGLLDLLHVAGDGQDAAADHDGRCRSSSSPSSRTSRSASSSTGSRRTCGRSGRASITRRLVPRTPAAAAPAARSARRGRRRRPSARTAPGTAPRRPEPAAAAEARNGARSRASRPPSRAA